MRTMVPQRSCNITLSSLLMLFLWLVLDHYKIHGHSTLRAGGFQRHAAHALSVLLLEFPPLDTLLSLPVQILYLLWAWPQGAAAAAAQGAAEATAAGTVESARGAASRTAGTAATGAATTISIAV